MADILIAAGSSMQPAPAGQVVLFIDTENNNILSYIDSAGTIKIYNAGDSSELEECCSCVIAKQWIDRVTCALQSGMLDATEFGTLISQGLIVEATETVDPATGAKTCKVEVGPKNYISNILPIAIVPNPSIIEGLKVDVTKQIIWICYPNGSNQAVTFLSSNPSIATVSSTGLVTGVAIGSCTVTIRSVANPSVFTIVSVYVTA